LEAEREAVTQRLNDFEAQMHYDYIEGLQDFLAVLRTQEVRTAIVTSSNRQKMDSVYRSRPELRLVFDEILTSEDFTESKPSPQCYLRAAQRLGVAPEDCVVFEDSFNGLRSGRAAGMYVVGLATTNTREAIAPLSDIQIDNYKHIKWQDI
jgi:HAD superfamily hydrolase (TIGR01509 family)